MSCMKVLFDISSSKITNTGISVYQTELIRELKKISGLTVSEIWYQPKFSRRSKLRSIDSFYRDLFWQEWIFRRNDVKTKADILHFPSYNFPPNRKDKILVTVHDIYSIIEPGCYKMWHAKIVNKYINLAVKQQRQILVPSFFVKEEILKHFHNANESCIHVVHSGISNLRFRVSDELLFKEIKSKYKIDRPYFLSVSTIEPRKNFLNLIAAFAKIANHIEHDLVLVGPDGWKNKKIYDLIHKLKLENRVHFTGFVSNEELNVLYSYASCFVFPSYYEGFGFTPLEAMKCGCPVVSSNASCMPEILGTAALFFAPDNIETMAVSIVNMLNNVELSKGYVEKGILQSQKYSWQRTALETFQLYNKILNKKIVSDSFQS